MIDSLIQTLLAALALLLVPAALVIIAAFKERSVSRQVLLPSENIPTSSSPVRQIIRAARHLQFR